MDFGNTWQKRMCLVQDAGWYLQGQGVTLKKGKKRLVFLVFSLTQSFMDGFGKYLAEMFISIKVCFICKTQVCTS